MRVSPVVLVCVTLLLASCGPDSKPATEVVKKVDAPKPQDESRRCPQTNLVDTKVVEKELMGQPFMPGGTLARYKKGAAEYEMFVAKFSNSDKPAFLLLDWKKAMTDAKLIPSFGGYSGMVDGRPVFVFSKGLWLACIAALPQAQADLEARTLAGRLN